jgi:hypothetical protein
MYGVSSFSTYYSLAKNRAIPPIDRSVLDGIESSLNFQYVTVPYQDFSVRLNPYGIYDRKIEAIPRALYAGIFKTIYHAGLATFKGIPYAICGDQCSLRINVYHIGKDLTDARKSISAFFYDDMDFFFAEQLEGNLGVYGRKIIAIPNALYSGILKTAYHTALIVFRGVPDATFKDTCSLRVNTYHLIRDLEETCGWIVTLFHDKVGSYLVEESLFHKAAYSIYETSRYDSDEQKGLESSVYKEAEGITLAQFKAMDRLDRKAAIEKFSLQNGIDHLGERFYGQLERASDEALALVSLIHLWGCHSRSGVNYALLSDAEFSRLTLSEFSKTSASQVGVIQKRLQFHKVNSESLVYENKLEMPISIFYKMTAAQISTFISEVPPSAFELFTEERFNGMDLSKASSKGLEVLFESFQTVEERKARLSSLPKSQLNTVFRKLPDYLVLDGIKSDLEQTKKY